ncbi:MULTISPECIES: ATP-binding protein [Brevibacterium]|uniref:ATP-binding protein n=1 Tax=Brevibacterium salitolerans TaxID=1403566 RepID=A0ABP5IIC9_9MICO|nr:ATP-binding protein [Brevibacterium sp.]
MTIGEVTDAAGLPEDETLHALLALPESQWHDRKSARIQPRKLAETLVAMGNAEGGTVVVGLSSGRAEHVDDARANALRQAAVDFTQPPVRIRTEETWALADGERRRLLLIRVLPGESLHEMTNGDCFLRIGDETRLLSHAQRQELFYDRSDSSYDSGTLRHISFSELDTTAIEQFRSALGAESEAVHLLRSRGLLDRQGAPTIAAALLFHPHPQIALPHAQVRILRYLSDERGSGTSLSLAEDGDTRIEGPLPSLIDRAAQTIDAQIPRRRALGPSGKFEAVPTVPRDAWLEALVNAVVHRSYSMAGDHIRVEIFPTRIEVTSPGRFPGIVDVDNPHSITRYARNPLIARVCADLRIGQELGEGIRRMVDVMERSGLEAPVFRQSASHVIVTLSAHSLLDRATVERLPKGAIATLAVLQHAGRPLGTGEIVEMLDVARPTALRRLRALEAEGMIVRDAQSPQDPRATWRLA